MVTVFTVNRLTIWYYFCVFQPGESKLEAGEENETRTKGENALPLSCVSRASHWPPLVQKKREEMTLVSKANG